MCKKLLIVGAGVFGMVAKEIAEDTCYYDEICFIDDNITKPHDNFDIIGTTMQLESVLDAFDDVIVAIGNPELRLSIICRIEEQNGSKLTSLISPRAYISKSAKISSGCIIEPMACVHTGCTLSEGCIVSAGAVVNHMSILGAGVHVDCNAVVKGNVTVPAGTKVQSCTLFEG